MNTYDAELCERLAREAREDDERMTPAPWIAKSDSLYHDSEDDGTILLADFGGEACIHDDAALARTRNNLRAMADQLDAARAEVMRLKASEDGLMRRMYTKGELVEIGWDPGGCNGKHDDGIADGNLTACSVRSGCGLPGCLYRRAARDKAP